MKLSCEIIEDLLPLYGDGVCSNHSRQAVEAHLRGCEKCRGLFASAQNLPHVALDTPSAAADKTVARSFRKIRRRWAASLLVIVILLPVLFCAGKLAIHEYRKEGLCFSNLDEAYTCRKFAKAIASEDYEKAASYLIYEGDWESIQAALHSTVEDHLPNMEDMSINGKTYLVDPYLSRHYLNGSGDGPETWRYLIRYNSGSMLIPQEDWLQLAAREPMEFDTSHEIIQYAYGNYWYRMDTQWGVFMTNDHANLNLAASDPAEVCVRSQIVPIQMYQALYPEILEYAREQHQISYDWNAYAKDMTLEEYTQYRRDEFVQNMKSLSQQGISLAYKGFEDAYLIEGEWRIQIRMDTSRGGKTYPVHFDISVSEEGLNIVGGDHPSQLPWDDILFNAII